MFLKLKTSCAVCFLTEAYHEIAIASQSKFFLVTLERLIWLFCGYLLDIWTPGGFDCWGNIQGWARRATAHAGRFLLHPNNLMLSVKLCEYYLLNVNFSTGETDDRCSLQNLWWAKSWCEGYYPCRICWPIYGLSFNALLIFQISNSSPALFMTSVWLLLYLFSWNA